MTTHKTVTVTKIPCDCKNDVRIIISHSQAVALVDALNNVGGEDDGPRGDLEMILGALEEKGYDVHTHEQRSEFMKGSVYFNDQS